MAEGEAELAVAQVADVEIHNALDLLRIKELEDALAFYANPDSYFAVFIVGDRPCGEFADDFSYCDHLAEYGPYDRPMPGKHARVTLALEVEQDG